ncbi:MAG: restriction endonuclease subunit S [Bellilinea sp.]
MTGRAFGVLFKDMGRFWEVSSNHISLTNRCEWGTVRLMDVCKLRFEIITEDELQEGKVELLDRISFDEGKIYSGKRTTTKMAIYRAKPNDIVVSKINARKRAIGIVPNGNDIGITIHFRSLIPDTRKIDSVFLWLALRNSFCTNQFAVETGGIGKGEISEDRLLNILIPLPPLDEQKKIITAWQQAQVIVTKARERVEELKQEVQKRILRDLGLPAFQNTRQIKYYAVWWKGISRWGVNANSQNREVSVYGGHFPVRRLRDVIQDLQNGWSPICLDRPVKGNEWGVLKLGSVSFGIFDPLANKALPKETKPRVKYEVKKGDVLISRSNTLSLVGASAFVDTEIERIIIPDLIFRVIWKDKSLVRGDFLATVLQTPPLRMQIESSANGTSPTMKKVTKPALLDLEIPLPSLSVQEEIMQRVKEGQRNILKEREAADKIAEEAEREVEEMILGLSKA